MSLKLNIGCGADYREGFVNVDGSTSLTKVDQVVNLSTESLADYFEAESCEFILAQDVVEHHTHWEAIRLLKEFYALLEPGGRLQVRVPDAEYIIKSWRMPLKTKLNLLFGGQDIPQGQNAEMDESRRKHPDFFCHKYGWTIATLSQELEALGFQPKEHRREGTNCVVVAQK